jgi:ubiquinone/menaquinone biosynthesis C-methylase UbiE
VSGQNTVCARQDRATPDSGDATPCLHAAVVSTDMREPYRSEFARLVQAGAGARDIHDTEAAGDYDRSDDPHASERFLQRELDRVLMHARSLCTPLARRIGSADRVLDVGCGTGGTTVALSGPELHAGMVVGLDASAEALEAARVRARAHGLDGDRVWFVHVAAGAALPFAAGCFDLVTCVSVLEFVSTQGGREALMAEMLRVLKPGGHLYLATPNPARARELHSGRWFGNQRRTPGYPWASNRRALRRMLAGCDVASMLRDRLASHPRLRWLAWAAPVLAWVAPWQRLLARKRS